MIQYINQLDYPAILYPTTLDPNETLHEPFPSVARAGCGLCCIGMVLSCFVGRKIKIEDCIQLSVECGANYDGTNMKLLSRYIGDKFNIVTDVSNDIKIVESTLKKGGLVIFNAGKRHGLFSDEGHFVLGTKIVDQKVYVLDPSFTKEKYSVPYRRKRIMVNDNYIITDINNIPEECKNRNPSYYLFWRKVQDP